MEYQPEKKKNHNWLNVGFPEVHYIKKNGFFKFSVTFLSGGRLSVLFELRRDYNNNGLSSAGLSLWLETLSLFLCANTKFFF